ncbi:hypothetical protein LEMLEM_LOCUS1748 [Lemmus lemmus]
MLTQPHPSGPPTCLLDTQHCCVMLERRLCPQKMHIWKLELTASQNVTVPRRASWELISKMRSFSYALNL